MSLEYKIFGQNALTNETVTPGDLIYVTASGYYDSAAIAYSTDGSAWTVTTRPSADEWKFIEYGSGTFVATPYYGPGNTMILSTDGAAWTTPTTPPSGSYVRGLAYGDSQFGLLVDSVAYTSPDGDVWTQVATGVSANHMTYGNGKFVAVSDLGAGTYSTDMVTWTAVTLGSGSESDFFGRASYANGIFFAGGYYGFSYSTDAVTWSYTNNSNVNGAVAYGSGAYAMLSLAPYGNYADVYTSTDLSTWTLATNDPTNGGSFDPDYVSLIYSEGKFIIAGYNTPEGIAHSSTDGVTWTASSTPGPYPMQALAVGGTPESIFYDPMTQYTVPTGKESVVSSMYIANTSTSSATYSIAIVPSGETLSDVHYIRKNTPISAQDFAVIDTKVTLSAGDSIVTSGTATMAVNIFGVEK